MPDDITEPAETPTDRLVHALEDWCEAMDERPRRKVYATKASDDVAQIVDAYKWEIRDEF